MEKARFFEPCLLFNIFVAMAQQLSPEQLKQAAAEFGTPLYVYHAEKIKEQYDRLLKAFEGTDARFFLCCKSIDKYQCVAVYQ